MKKTTENQWVSAIEASRSLFQQSRFHQMKIAELALSVCEITHGGNMKNGITQERYTIKRFSKEVGVNQKTLSTWIAVKTLIYDRLDAQRKRNCRYTDLQRTCRLINKKTPPAKVIKLFDDYKNMDQFEARIVNYMDDLRSLCFNFKKQSAALRCSKETLKEILFFTRSISEEISKEHPRLGGKLMGVASRQKGFHSAAKAILGTRPVSKVN